MNNSKVIKDNLEELEEETTGEGNKPLLRQQEMELLEIIEAIENIKSSGYWKKLEEKVFSVELSKLQSLLCQEKDPTVMFRLQGQIVGVKKFDLEKMLSVRRNELALVRSSLIK
jgi:hypothetical protein